MADSSQKHLLPSFNHLLLRVPSCPQTVSSRIGAAAKRPLGIFVNVAHKRFGTRKKLQKSDCCLSKTPTPQSRLQGYEVGNYSETAKRLWFSRKGMMPSDRRARLANLISFATLMDPLPASVGGMSAQVEKLGVNCRCTR
jgi:hypothetical protein